LEWKTICWFSSSNQNIVGFRNGRSSR